jgi:hypothetical protein
MWIYANPNPCRQEEPDCVIRAIAIATDQSWKKVHWDLCMMSHDKCTMPSVNWLWGLYLSRYGFEKFLLSDECPACVNVREFCRMFPEGTYVLATGSHAVCAINGNWFDTWDSGDETVTYIFRKRGL